MSRFTKFSMWFQIICLAVVLALSLLTLRLNRETKRILDRRPKLRMSTLVRMEGNRAWFYTYNNRDEPELIWMDREAFLKRWRPLSPDGVTYGCDR